MSQGTYGCHFYYSPTAAIWYRRPCRKQNNMD